MQPGNVGVFNQLYPLQDAAPHSEEGSFAVHRDVACRERYACDIAETVNVHFGETDKSKTEGFLVSHSSRGNETKISPR